MPELQYTPDKELTLHQENAIRQLVQRFAEHSRGIPEWVKNSADAYIRSETPRERRLIVIIFDHSHRGRPASISCLDFVGMTSRDIETYFRRWADPNAAAAGQETSSVQGGHGHGGKAYMVQMFDAYAYIHTVKRNKGCKYAVPAGTVHFGYMPNAEDARDFAVPDLRGELGEALADMGTQLHSLPSAVLDAIAEADGFTLVKGLGPKGYGNRIPVPHLRDALLGDSQMTRSLQLCDVYVVNNGRLDPGEPLALPEIPPMAGAEEPRETPIPEILTNPDTREPLSSTDTGRFPAGKLVLRTSEKSMRWRPRVYRHSIRFLARSDFIGEVGMTELDIRSKYRDNMYGDCMLDALDEYCQSERRQLTVSPLTRAVRQWMREQIEAYCHEFEERDRRRYTQSERDALTRINAALDLWKNRFLEEMSEGLWGEGSGIVRPSVERLPSGTADRLLLTASHSRAGVGVSIRPVLKAIDREGQRVRLPPYTWVSTDTNIAMVDEDLLSINTFSFGSTQIYAEALDSGLRSNPITLEIVHIYEIAIEPRRLELPSGSRRRLNAVSTLADRETTSDIYVLWLVNDDSIAGVSPAGLVYGREPGETDVYAMDDHCTSSAPAKVRVLPASGGHGPGGRRGRAYPRVLISEIDPDPETQELVSFSLEAAPVEQRVQDVPRHIYWINSASPLAQLYLDKEAGYGYESTQWRGYHLERYIEAMARIRLNLEYQPGEEIAYDLWERRCGEVAAQMQAQAVSSLQSFLKEGQLPGA